MASHGKVLDLLDDRYLDLQDVTGNVEPLPTLVPYEEYTQNVLVYRMDTNHAIFMGLIQDFTLRRAHETRKELWTWLLQWEVDDIPLVQQPSSLKKVRLNAQQAYPSVKVPTTPHKPPALTIFERRTLDGALTLEEDMLRILIDIVQVSSSLVPNFIEFLYRWVDYYEGDGKALKAALMWEIPSLWDFEYHPLVLQRDDKKDRDTARSSETQHGKAREGRAGSLNQNKAEELRQSSPTKKMHARPKPDLVAIELQTFYAEESERLQYREVKFGIQPPKIDLPLPPLINIPRDVRKRTKYYAACHKSRQRALFLLLEAGLTMRQINNYQKLQTEHPKETPETGDGNGLRNYQKDAKYAQAQYELKEKQIKQREIAISTKLAVEAQLAATHAIPDGAAGLPLIPPTPLYARKPDMAGEMMQKIKASREKKDDSKISIVPQPLVGLLKSKVFEGAHSRPSSRDLWVRAGLRGGAEDDGENDGQDTEVGNASSSSDGDRSDESGEDDENGIPAAIPESTPNLPRPTLPMPRLPQPLTAPADWSSILASAATSTFLPASNLQPAQTSDQPTTSSIAAYMRNLNTEQAQRLLPLLRPHVRQAAPSTLRESLHVQGTVQAAPSSDIGSAEISSSNLSSFLINPSNAQHSLRTPTRLSPHPASHSQQSTGQVGQGQTVTVQRTSPSPSSLASPLTLPRQRTSNSSLATSQPPTRQQSVAPSLPPPWPAALHQNTTSRGPRSNPAYSLSPTTAQSPAVNAHSPAAVSPSFDPDVFLHLRRQQEEARSGTSAGAVLQPAPPVFSDEQALQPSSVTACGLGQRSPAERQRVLSDVFNHRTNAAQAGPATRDLNEWESADRGPVSLHPPATSSVPHPLPRLNIQPSSPQQPSASQHLQNSASLAPSPTPTQPASSASMPPPPRPGSTRHVPKPLSLPQPPSPFSTLGPEMLATSPFLAPDTQQPIQIYFPKIVIPGNGAGPGGTPMGDAGLETDALMLGHEDATGRLVLSRAILLPVGVWANTLRKVCSGRWSVLEAYPVPTSHPARGKGKARAGSEEGCHRAVYGKLVQAFGIMGGGSEREGDLTKRWRVSRGLMTRWDRGAVWEGWGAYVERGIEMSAEEREDAVRGGSEGTGIEGYGPDEAERRRREMDELMDDEDVETDDENDEMDDEDDEMDDEDDEMDD